MMDRMKDTSMYSWKRPPSDPDDMATPAKRLCTPTTTSSSSMEFSQLSTKFNLSLNMYVSGNFLQDTLKQFAFNLLTVLRKQGLHVHPLTFDFTSSFVTTFLHLQWKGGKIPLFKDSVVPSFVDHTAHVQNATVCSLSNLQVRAPVLPHKAAVLPANAPILPAKATVLPAKTTVLPAKATVLPAKATVLPAKASLVRHKAPVLPGKASLVRHKAPVLPGKAPLPPAKAPILHGKAPVLPGKNPFLPGKAPIPLGKAPMLPGKAPVLPGKAPSVLSVSSKARDGESCAGCADDADLVAQDRTTQTCTPSRHQTPCSERSTQTDRGVMGNTVQRTQTNVGIASKNEQSTQTDTCIVNPFQQDVQPYVELKEVSAARETETLCPALVVPEEMQSEKSVETENKGPAVESPGGEVIGDEGSVEGEDYRSSTVQLCGHLIPLIEPHVNSLLQQREDQPTAGEHSAQQSVPPAQSSPLTQSGVQPPTEQPPDGAFPENVSTSRGRDNVSLGDTVQSVAALPQGNMAQFSGCPNSQGNQGQPNYSQPSEAQAACTDSRPSPFSPDAKFFVNPVHNCTCQAQMRCEHPGGNAPGPGYGACSGTVRSAAPLGARLFQTDGNVVPLTSGGCGVMNPPPHRHLQAVNCAMPCRNSRLSANVPRQAMHAPYRPAVGTIPTRINPGGAPSHPCPVMRASVPRFDKHLSPCSSRFPGVVTHCVRRSVNNLVHLTGVHSGVTTPCHTPVAPFSVCSEQTQCAAPSGILTAASSGILTAAPSGILTAASSGTLTAASSGILTAAPSGILTAASSGILTAASSGMLTAASSGILTAAPSGILTAASSGILTAASSGMLTAASSGILTAASSGILTAASSGMLTAASSGMLTAASSGMLTAASSGMLTAASSGMLTAASSDMLTAAFSGMLTATSSDMLTAASSDMLTAYNAQAERPTSTDSFTVRTDPKGRAVPQSAVSAGHAIATLNVQFSVNGRSIPQPAASGGHHHQAEGQVVSSPCHVHSHEASSPVASCQMTSSPRHVQSHEASSPVASCQMTSSPRHVHSHEASSPVASCQMTSSPSRIHPKDAANPILSPSWKECGPSTAPSREGLQPGAGGTRQGQQSVCFSEHAVQTPNSNVALNRALFPSSVVQTDRVLPPSSKDLTKGSTAAADTEVPEVRCVLSGGLLEGRQQDDMISVLGLGQHVQSADYTGQTGHEPMDTVDGKSVSSEKLASCEKSMSSDPRHVSVGSYYRGRIPSLHAIPLPDERLFRARGLAESAGHAQVCDQIDSEAQASASAINMMDTDNDHTYNNNMSTPPRPSEQILTDKDDVQSNTGDKQNTLGHIQTNTDDKQTKRGRIKTLVNQIQLIVGQLSGGQAQSPSLSRSQEDDSPSKSHCQEKGVSPQRTASSTQNEQSPSSASVSQDGSRKETCSVAQKSTSKSENSSRCSSKKSRFDRIKSHDSANQHDVSAVAAGAMNGETASMVQSQAANTSQSVNTSYGSLTQSAMSERSDKCTDPSSGQDKCRSVPCLTVSRSSGKEGRRHQGMQTDRLTTWNRWTMTFKPKRMNRRIMTDRHRTREDGTMTDPITRHERSTLTDKNITKDASTLTRRFKPIICRSSQTVTAVADVATETEPAPAAVKTERGMMMDSTEPHEHTMTLVTPITSLQQTQLLNNEHKTLTTTSIITSSEQTQQLTKTAHTAMAAVSCLQSLQHLMKDQHEQKALTTASSSQGATQVTKKAKMEETNYEKIVLTTTAAISSLKEPPQQMAKTDHKASTSTPSSQESHQMTHKALTSTPSSQESRHRMTHKALTSTPSSQESRHRMTHKALTSTPSSQESRHRMTHKALTSTPSSQESRHRMTHKALTSTPSSQESHQMTHKALTSTPSSQESHQMTHKALTSTPSSQESHQMTHKALTSTPSSQESRHRMTHKALTSTPSSQKPQQMTHKALTSTPSSQEPRHRMTHKALTSTPSSQKPQQMTHKDLTSTPSSQESHQMTHKASTPSSQESRQRMTHKALTSTPSSQESRHLMTKQARLESDHTDLRADSVEEGRMLSPRKSGCDGRQACEKVEGLGDMDTAPTEQNTIRITIKVKVGKGCNLRLAS